MLLLDINVWLALTFDSHVHHAAALSWYNALSDTEVCCFCRLTQQGFLRLATNPKVFPGSALSMDEAWQKYELLLSDPHIVYVNEPPNIEQGWRNFTRGGQFAPNAWSDAYLAAFANAAGIGLATFDQGFTQYAGTACTFLV